MMSTVEISLVDVLHLFSNEAIMTSFVPRVHGTRHVDRQFRRGRVRQLLIERFESRQLLAADFEPLKVLTPGTQSSNPVSLTAFGGALYFVAATEIGTELWKTDGTSTGTVLVKDISPDGLGSYPTNLTVAGGSLFFSAITRANGRELWKTDGTAAGTVMVKDILNGSPNSYPNSLVNVNDVLYFRASDGFNGEELWKSDGTTSGTTLVKDIRSGAIGSGPSNLTNFGGQLAFTANDGVSGTELWRSDGTTGGTVLVSDMRPGSTGSYPNSLGQVGSFLYFSANDGNNGIELWRSGGTAVTTGLVANINLQAGAGSTPQSLVNVNGVLYFIATDAQGRELWKSDGSAGGTTIVKDIRAGVSSSYPSRLTNVGGTLYLSADDGLNGAELWRSDGTTAGTFMVSNLNPGSASSNPANFVTFNGAVFFTATDIGDALWKTDGTSTGTAIIQHGAPANFNPMVGLTPFAGSLFFSVQDATLDRELWKSDGTAPGTFELKDINTTPQLTATTLIGQTGTRQLFVASTVGTGTALWSTDGSEAGTTFIRDINPISAGLAIDPGVSINGVVYFGADDGSSGKELWRSDGTSAGTFRVKDINVGSGSSLLENLTNVDGILFFSAADTINGNELWRSDGTEVGTVLVKDIRTGALGSYPRYLANGNGELYFSANDGTNGAELWRSDGTASGTILIKNIAATLGSYPKFFTSVNNKILFNAYEGVSGSELWVTDGTSTGTSLLANIRSGNSSSYPNALTVVGNQLFFTASDATGSELWRTDGTPIGTTQVKDINPGAYSSYLSSLTNFNGTLYFSANDFSSGRELWKSDGSAAGTVQVADINPGPGGTNLGPIYKVGGQLAFVAAGATRSQTFVSDGTGAGTLPLLNSTANNSILSAQPTNIFELNNQLYAMSGEILRVRQNVEVDLSTSTSDTSLVARKTAFGVEVVNQNTSAQLAFISNLAMANVQSLTMRGSNTANENITLDYVSGGMFSFPAGIDILGGSSTGDSLSIIGNVSQRLEWQSDPNSIADSFKVRQGSLSAIGSIGGIESITASGLLSATAIDLLKVGPPNLLLNMPGTLSLAPINQLGGGTLSTTSLASLSAGGIVTGTGSILGRFTGELGSLILPTGSLAIGSSASPSGFITRGDLVVDQFSVSLLDSNEAVLGSQTSLGNATTPGSVTAANGMLLDFGNNISGYGSINTPNLASKPFTLNGTVQGTSVANPVTLTGYIKGVGNLANVSIAGTYSPGFSPAAVTVGSLSYAPTATTLIELGGTAPGTGHDQINHIGAAVLGGTLNVQLINSFVPSVGDSFTIMTATTGFTGSFATQLLPTPPLGSGWQVTVNANSIVLKLFDLANVVGAQFGDGTLQRSRIDRLDVTFDGLVDIDAGAFSMLKRGTAGGLVANSFVTSVNGSGNTVATLSFSGAFTRAGGALVDGYYQLTIDNTKVRRATTSLALDGDNNGLAGGNFTRGTSATDAFFAYYGDTNGDGSVGVTEFGQFRSSFGKLPTDAGYNLNFDFDGGGIGVADFGQFRSRFGKSIDFE